MKDLVHCSGFVGICRREPVSAGREEGERQDGRVRVAGGGHAAEVANQKGGLVL
jgi:hypothetical protein